MRSSGSGTVAALRASAWCDSPNQPPSARAVASTRCSCGAARETIRSASAKRSESVSRSIAASSRSSSRAHERQTSYSEVAQAGGEQAGEAADQAADDAGVGVGGRLEDRQRQQDDGDDRDADPVVLLVDRQARLGAADREPGGERAQRQAVAAGHHLDPVPGR